jgi:hypothetical protein
MKFWKQYLVAAFVLIVIAGTAVFQSCEKNNCNNLTCQNGGSCGNGLCTCPAGWDGPTCIIRTVDRFLGAYAGSTYCNEGAPVIDSVFVIQDTSVSPLTVKVVLHTNRYDTLIGTVNYNTTAEQILIPTQYYSAKFWEQYTVTLEYGNQLTVNTFSDDNTNPHIEVQNKCQFVGTWVPIK